MRYSFCQIPSWAALSCVLEQKYYESPVPALYLHRSLSMAEVYNFTAFGLYGIDCPFFGLIMESSAASRVTASILSSLPSVPFSDPLS